MINLSAVFMLLEISGELSQRVGQIASSMAPSFPAARYPEADTLAHAAARRVVCVGSTARFMLPALGTTATARRAPSMSFPRRNDPANVDYSAAESNAGNRQAFNEGGRFVRKPKRGSIGVTNGVQG
eukprot:6209197-Pleurochrysis_carterae.AAC.1